jgi:hypothetical protein
MIESENVGSVFLVTVVMFIHKCCLYYSAIIAGVPGCCYLQCIFQALFPAQRLMRMT